MIFKKKFFFSFNLPFKYSSIRGEKRIILHNLKEEKRKGKKAYSTCCSQAVTHPSTGQARRCLTSVIRREPVYSAWYGRRQQWMVVIDLNTRLLEGKKDYFA